MDLDINTIVTEQAKAAKKASKKLALLSSAEKNKALYAMAHALETKTPIILKANMLDMEDGRQ